MGFREKQTDSNAYTVQTTKGTRFCSQRKKTKSKKNKTILYHLRIQSGVRLRQLQQFDT